MQNGKYHLNFHIVTGRKPMHLRTGDLMINGERREMTNSKYDASKQNCIECYKTYVNFSGLTYVGSSGQV